MLHVPYKGQAPALSDTIAGQTSVLVASPSAALPHIKSGRLRALAVTSAERADALPDVPTVAEAGVPGYEMVMWYGLIAPAGVPRDIVERLNGEVGKILATRETKEHLRSDTAVAVGGTPEQFQDRIRKDIAVWQKVVAERGIRAD